MNITLRVYQDEVETALPLIQGEPQRALTQGLPRFAQLKKVLTTDID